MNIWYLNHYAGGLGVGRYSRAFHLAQAWQKQGHEATVFVASFHHLLEGTSPLPPEVDVRGVRYVSLPSRVYDGNGVRRLLNIADYCRSVPGLAGRIGRDLTNPDAIIVTSPHPFAIYATRRLARRTGAALIFEARDLWGLSMTEVNGTSPLHPFVLLCRRAERFACRHADLVASTLAKAEAYMRKDGLPAGRFVYVPNGIDPDEASAQPPQSEAGRTARRQLEAWRGEGRMVLIHPGAQGAANGLDRLLDAAALLKSRGLEGRLGILLVGRGDLTGRLTRQAADLGLANVAFAGALPKEEALWLTANSDAGYAGGRDHPRLYRYGISFNKIMDFMAAGLPVVLPLSAGGDPVSAAGCGIVTDSDRPEAIASAVEQLLEAGPEGRKEMGYRGRDHAARFFDYRRIAATYAEAISKARADMKAA